MPYNTTHDELKALRKENAELKAKLKEIELSKSDYFSSMDYDTLMSYYIKGELAFMKDDDPILTRWRLAYQVFKDIRSERSMAIRHYMAKYFATKKNCPVLLRDVVVQEIRKDIERIYREITPFDVKPDERSGTWVSRAQKAIRDTESENGLWFRDECVSVWRK